MAVAAKRDFEDNPDTALRVATKFPNIAKHYYAEKSREIEIIKLNGSIELAPLFGAQRRHCRYRRDGKDAFGE